MQCIHSAPSAVFKDDFTWPAPITSAKVRQGLLSMSNRSGIHPNIVRGSDRNISRYCVKENLFMSPKPW